MLDRVRVLRTLFVMLSSVTPKRSPAHRFADRSLFAMGIPRTLLNALILHCKSGSSSGALALVKACKFIREFQERVSKNTLSLSLSCYMGI